MRVSPTPPVSVADDSTSILFIYLRLERNTVSESVGRFEYIDVDASWSYV